MLAFIGRHFSHLWTDAATSRPGSIWLMLFEIAGSLVGTARRNHLAAGIGEWQRPDGTIRSQARPAGWPVIGNDPRSPGCR